MPASEPKAQVQPRPQSQPYELTGVTMRELLASCAAADAISRPPREPGPTGPEAAIGHRKVA